jgi:hypothetical protein
MKMKNKKTWFWGVAFLLLSAGMTLAIVPGKSKAKTDACCAKDGKHAATPPSEQAAPAPIDKTQLPAGHPDIDAAMISKVPAPALSDEVLKDENVSCPYMAEAQKKGTKQ